MKRWLVLAMIISLLLVFGCAEKAPPTYYVHFSGDGEMDKHIEAVVEFLDDLDVEMATASYNRAIERLVYLHSVGYNRAAITHYQTTLEKLRQDLAVASQVSKNAVRVTFTVGFDPETMTPDEEGFHLGDLRKRLGRAPYQRRVEVNHLILYYTKGPGRGQYERYLRRLSLYRNHIRRVMASYGVPQELVCVPMIESAGDPTRVSHAGAAGLWQFMPATARKYNLLVTNDVDQRFDPVLETYAAAEYFKFLIHYFNDDFDAALAAYNCGEGFIGNVVAHPAIKSIWDAPYHGKETDDGTIPSIPRETYDYITRWYAVAIVYQNLEDYGFSLPTTPEDPFMLVHVQGAVETMKLSEDLGVPHETLVGMNPSLRTGRTPPDQKTAIRLPPAFADQYVEKLRSAQQYRISYVYRHKVTSYETLRKIAAMYNVSVVRISEYNDLGEKTRLEAGMVIAIPTTAGNPHAKLAAGNNVKYWRELKGTLWDKKR